MGRRAGGGRTFKRRGRFWKVFERPGAEGRVAGAAGGLRVFYVAAELHGSG